MKKFVLAQTANTSTNSAVLKLIEDRMLECYGNPNGVWNKFGKCSENPTSVTTLCSFEGELGGSGWGFSITGSFKKNKNYIVVFNTYSCSDATNSCCDRVKDQGSEVISATLKK